MVIGKLQFGLVLPSLTAKDADKEVTSRTSPQMPQIYGAPYSPAPPSQWFNIRTLYIWFLDSFFSLKLYGDISAHQPLETK